MPLHKRLVLAYSPAEKTPLPVILTLRDGEELRCLVQPGYTEGVFRIMLDPGHRIHPRIIAHSHYLPEGMVSVCAAPEGHLHLDVGQPISLTFSVRDENGGRNVTLHAGILDDFTIL